VWQPEPYERLAEPACGEGAIVTAISRRFADHDLAWDLTDIRDIEHSDMAVFKYHHMDFFARQPDESTRRVSTVITNPPFSLAEKFLRHAREVYAHARIILLLRLNFLGSEERVPFWAEVGMPDVFVLPNRPSFVKGRKDSCEYGWFVWPRASASSQPVQSYGRLQMLASTPKSIRCPPRPKKGSS